MKRGRSWTPAVSGSEGERIIQLQSLDDVAVKTEDASPSLKDRGYEKRLAACAAAYAAVMLSGPVKAELRDKTLILTPLQGECSNEVSDFDVVEVVGTDAQVAQQRIVRYRAIMGMLIQRCVLKEVEMSERSLTGANDVIAKYALSGNIWMEAFLKFVAVALVAVVSNESGLKLSVAIALFAAANIALSQPYMQKQVNILQCFGFLCLACAAVGFHQRWAWLTRSTLVLPFLLAAALSLHPDSPAMLASRLFKEICSQLDDLQAGKSIQLNVELANFI
ncbi:FLS2 [Symbiodinium sp. CCMP2592]|nr:FLS2 [Symbiodinium sp. CCMP2592]